MTPAGHHGVHPHDLRLSPGVATMPNTVEAQRKRRLQRRRCGGCGGRAEKMRPWGAIEIPICAGCDALLRTRADDGGLQVVAVAAGPQLLGGGGQLAPAAVLEDA